MHGIVSRGIRNMVIVGYGKDVWLKIKEEAGIQHMVLNQMENYDDEQTFRIVAATSKVLGKAGEEVLEDFGRTWVDYLTAQGFGDMLKLAGKTFPEFMSNLNNIHLRMGSSLKGTCPPSFSIEQIDEHSLLLEYYSTRRGLLPFLMGVFVGIGKLFQVHIEAIHHSEQDSAVNIEGENPELVCPPDMGRPIRLCETQRHRFLQKLTLKYYPLEKEEVEIKNEVDNPKNRKDFVTTCPFKRS